MTIMARYESTNDSLYPGQLIHGYPIHEYIILMKVSALQQNG